MCTNREIIDNNDVWAIGIVTAAPKHTKNIAVETQWINSNHKHWEQCTSTDSVQYSKQSVYIALSLYAYDQTHADTSENHTQRKILNRSLDEVIWIYFSKHWTEPSLF